MSQTTAQRIEETHFQTASNSSWAECPDCGATDVTVVVRRKSDERGVLKDRLSDATIAFECPNCDADSYSELDEDDTEGSDDGSDAIEVLLMIPPLFDSNAPTDERLQGALVLGTLLAVVGYWVYSTVL